MDNQNVTVEPPHLWWTEIAGPSSYLAKIEEMLSDETPVVTVISYSLPFRQEFRGEVCDRARALGYVTHIIESDMADNEGYEDVGEALVRRFRQAGDLLPEYIRQKRNPRYLKKSGAFCGQLIWVKGLNRGRLNKWIKFVSGFGSRGGAGKADAGTAFIIEVIDGAFLPDRLPENICRLNYTDFIKEDDLHLFTSILVENRMNDENSAAKRYATELITSICGIDSEIADAMAREEVVSVDPIALLQQVRDEQFPDSPRGIEDRSHPFSMLQSVREDDLRRAVWIAQLRTAFPLIEQERLAIIHSYEKEIKCALTSEVFYDFDGERILDPFDVEIGLLYKLTHMRNEDGLYLLYIPDETMRDRISHLRICRNTLAHRNICTVDQFRELLSID